MYATHDITHTDTHRPKPNKSNAKETWKISLLTTSKWVLFEEYESHRCPPKAPRKNGAETQHPPSDPRINKVKSESYLRRMNIRTWKHKDIRSLQDAKVYTRYETLNMEKREIKIIKQTPRLTYTHRHTKQAHLQNDYSPNKTPSNLAPKSRHAEQKEKKYNVQNELLGFRGNGGTHFESMGNRITNTHEENKTQCTKTGKTSSAE